MLSGLRERRALCAVARELIQGQGEYDLSRKTLSAQPGVSEHRVERVFLCDHDLRLSIADSELYSHFKHLEYSYRLHRQPAKALLYHACWIAYEAQVMGRFPLHKLVPGEALIFSASAETSRRYLRSLANYNDYLTNLMKMLVSPKLAGVLELYKWMAGDFSLQEKNRSLDALQGYVSLVESVSSLLELESESRPSREELAQWLISEFSAADPYESTLAVGL
ncbi:hypothetical protein [Ferrimonas sp. YFM]|uniref:hypothetical protein n=1 Tax=Ferrimonas sp. YFM TaxID=3028878 RepID=UPI0025740492|nr:hypothetical protein [Ferrimonas sp. YFM]BDY06014.1 hypothetical protein F0521_30550 [Ferrimonas sp. YFM]